MTRGVATWATGTEHCDARCRTFFSEQRWAEIEEPAWNLAVSSTGGASGSRLTHAPPRFSWIPILRSGNSLDVTALAWPSQLVLSAERAGAKSHPFSSKMPASTTRPTTPRSAADEARLRTLVRDHHALVFRAVRRLGVNEADADDATQEVFLVLANRLADIEAGKERSFLYSTAARVAANARRSVRRRVAAHDNLENAPRESQPLQDTLSDQRRAREVLDELLDSLPDDMREVLVLFELKELSVQEIAEVLDVPLGTVGSRLRRARERFQAGISRYRAQMNFRLGGNNDG